MDELQKLYEQYCHLNDDIPKGCSKYYNLLQDEFVKGSRDDEMLKLFPDELSDTERQIRKAIEYLYLWDILFYNVGYEYKSSYIWKNEAHQEDIISKIKEKIKIGLDEYLNGVLLSICSHWPNLRDLIYDEDKSKLDMCSSTKDYKTFIEKHPNTYKEYYLKAKYEFCNLSGIVFTEFNDVLVQFPDSTLIDTKKLRDKCKLIGNIHVLFNDELTTNTELKMCVTNCINNLQIFCSEKKQNFSLTKLLLIKDFIQIMQRNFNSNIVQIINCDDYYLGTFNELEDYAKRLSYLTCVKFEIPQEDLVVNYIQSIDTNSTIYKNLINCGYIGIWCVDRHSKPTIKLLCNSNKSYNNVHPNSYALFLLSSKLSQ